MLKIWFVFFFVTYAISVLTLSHIQVRGRARAGSWRSFNKQPFIQTYWRQLSTAERILLWTGSTAFAVTCLGMGLFELWIKVNG
jgi:hypothetical protein